MKKLLFVDLDDTLFQSHAKRPVSDDFVPMAYLKDGNPISFATPSQLSMLGMFQKEMAVIPVTARNMEAFSRVRINFSDGAVLNYGGVILQADGRVDDAWLERSRQHSSTELEALTFFQAFIEAESSRRNLDVKARIISDLELPFYVVAKSPSYDTDAILDIAELCRHQCAGDFCSYRVHVNGNNIAVLPGWLDKGHAVKYLVEKLSKTEDNLLTFGMGDSLIDLGFMGACQYMIVPSSSQIACNRLAAL
ncbi:MAG: hypothetical protein ACNA7G_13265 [Methylobacter sp.]